MFAEIQTLLQDLPPITLSEMKGIRLMNRTDTKVLTNKEALKKLLLLAKEDYYVQEIKGKRISCYQTTYWDTPEHRFYLIHHDGNKPRTKVRVRTYMDSNESFLEIKHKDNHGKTDKKRIKVTQEDFMTSQEGQTFLTELTGMSASQLHPSLQNRFERITLVNRKKTERLTIDFNILFTNPETGNQSHTNNLVVVELKRDGNIASPIKELLLQLRIKPYGFSKYCIGSLLTNSTLKRNLFKPKLVQIKRLANS